MSSRKKFRDHFGVFSSRGARVSDRVLSLIGTRSGMKGTSIVLCNHRQIVPLSELEKQECIGQACLDIVSTYAGVRILDIYHTLISTSTATHEYPTKDNASIKAWHNKLFYLIDVGVPGMPALYTPASQARSMERFGDD